MTPKLGKLTGVERTEFGFRASPKPQNLSRRYLGVSLSLPVELFTTDRVMKRWAVSTGSGLPEEKWDDNPKSRLSPLDDESAIVVDQIVCKSPPQTQELIVLWYKTPIPVSEIARKLRMRHESIYRGHALVLYYIKWKFVGSKHKDLISLINKNVEVLGNFEYAPT